MEYLTIKRNFALNPEDLYLMVDNKAKSFRTCGKNGAYVLECSEAVEKLPKFEVFEESYLKIIDKIMPNYSVDGFIRDEETLIKLGEHIWEELYRIYGVKPKFESR